MSSYDYSEFKESGTELLQAISDAGDQLLEAEKEVTEAEKILKQKELKLRELTDKIVPELMDRAGMEEFKLKDGRKVTVSENIRASLSQERMDQGAAWLRDNGHGSIVKTQVISEFGMGHVDDAEKYFLEARKNNTAHTIFKTSVHASSLTSLVTELIKQEQEVPVDLFKVTRLRIAKVK